MGKIAEVTVNGYKAVLSLEDEEYITVIERDYNSPKEELSISNKKNVKHENHSFLGIMIISIMLIISLMCSLIGCKSEEGDVYNEETSLFSNLEFESDIYEVEMSMPDFVCYKDKVNEDATNLIVISKVSDDVYNDLSKAIPNVEGNQNAIVNIPKEEIPNELFDDVAYEYEADEIKMNLFYYKDNENNLYSITYSSSVDNFDEDKLIAYKELSKLKFI